MIEALTLNLTPEKRERLKIEFDQLDSIEKKYRFWNVKLERNYYLWAFYEQENIRDFLISPQVRPDIEILNKLIYSDYSLFIGSNKPLNSQRKDFLKLIETAPDKENLIDYELKKIDEYIFKRKQTKITNNFTQYEKDGYFIRGYEDFLLLKKDIDWGKEVYQAHLLHEKIQGTEWAKYRDFVKSYLKPQRKQDEVKLNGEQKFLALYYLGFGNDLKANTHKSVLYNFFIPELKTSSIRPMLSDIKMYETESNLYALLNFFRLIKLDLKVQEIQGKIDKLRKKR